MRLYNPDSKCIHVSFSARLREAPRAIAEANLARAASTPLAAAFATVLTLSREPPYTPNRTGVSSLLKKGTGSERPLDLVANF